MGRGSQTTTVLMLAAHAALLGPRLALALSKETNAPPGEIPDLRPPEDLLAPTFWEQHGGKVAVIAVLVMGVLVLAVWLWRRPKAVIVTPRDALARQALERLRGQPEDEALCAEVSIQLHRYVQAVGGLPPDELTAEELLGALDRLPFVPKDLFSALGALLRECDARKFAPVAPPPTPGLVDRALELVARFEAWRRPPALPGQLPTRTRNT